MSDLKKFRVYWEADVRGCKEVMAYDEEDAREQIDGTRLDMDLFEDSDSTCVEVDLAEEIKLVSEPKAKKNGKTKGRGKK